VYPINVNPNAECKFGCRAGLFPHGNKPDWVNQGLCFYR